MTENKQLSYDEILKKTQWEWRLKILRQLRKENRTNLDLRYLQTKSIRDIELHLRGLYD